MINRLIDFTITPSEILVRIRIRSDGSLRVKHSCSIRQASATRSCNRLVWSIIQIVRSNLRRNCT